MQQHIQKIKEYVQTNDRELEGIKRTLKSLTRSPYSVSESVNRLKERKETLLKQKQRYKELMVFLE
jgi:archaellum component FlaC